MDRPLLSRIRIYPIKSLDPLELVETEVGVYSLRHDREFAMVAKDGGYVNGKRTGRVNQLKADYDLSKQCIRLGDRVNGFTREFHLVDERIELEKYLTAFFDMEVRLIQNTQGELLDIPGASSVTILSEASLISLQKDLGTHGLEDLRLRFRSNLELAGAEAFWEEQFFGEPGTGMRIQVGEVEMIGISPRARCNVPPRDPFSGETDKTFIKSMMRSRAGSLPSNSCLPHYGNFYHLTVNTYIPETETGKRLKVGDPVRILGPVDLTRGKGGVG